MIKCPKCKSKNPEGTVFCKKCGERFSKEISGKKAQVTGSEITVGSIAAVGSACILMLLGVILIFLLPPIGLIFIIVAFVVIFAGGLGVIIGIIKGIADWIQGRKEKS